MCDVFACWVKYGYQPSNIQLIQEEEDEEEEEHTWRPGGALSVCVIANPLRSNTRMCAMIVDSVDAVSSRVSGCEGGEVGEVDEV